MRFPTLPIPLLAVSALAACLAEAGPARAESESPLLVSDAGPTLHGRLRLGLEDAIAMGLENNLDVEVERYAPAIAEQDAEGAWGAFDPELFAEFGYDTRETPIASTLQESAELIERSTDGEGGLRGLLPFLGADYSLSLLGERNTTNSSIASLSPELRSVLALQVNVPLLRDLIWNQPWTLVKTAGLLHESSLEDFRRTVLDTVRDIETAYWNLVATEEQLRVERKSLETSQALLEQTETQYEVGVVSRVEVVEAEAGVADREFRVIRAENSYRNAQDLLIDLVLGDYLTAGSRLEIEATDKPEEYVVYDVDVENSMQRAFAKRPELVVARKEIERNQVQRRFARNQWLPRFDVQLGYGFQGLAGEENPNRTDFTAGTRNLIGEINDRLPGCDPMVPGDPDCIDEPPPPSPILAPRSFGSTFDDYFTADGSDQFAVRGVFSIPFPNTTASRNLTKAELELRRARTRLSRVEQGIILEVRDAARNLESAQQGIEAAERRRLAAEEQLRAERIRLEHGESTPFDVLERERDLVEAESQKIGALQVYRTSVAQLDRAQGTSLESRNIEIEEIRRLR